MSDSPSGSAGFDFSRYVAGRKAEVFGGDGAARYAYSADITMLRAFRRMRPVELAAAAVVRMFKDVLKNQLLGTTVKVGPRQFPSLHKIAEDCARTLGVPTPQIYVTNNPVVNAYTFGTDEEAFIVVHSALVDHFDEDELRFVIGHETGHIQNKHVVYGTILILMKNTTAALLALLVPPVEVALHAWYRRAEITCDRAGLLCTGSIDPAVRGFLKLACGSKKMYAELDVDAYLEQLPEGRQGVGRYAELFATHPYVPKRIEALRVFAESALYREATRRGAGGLTMEDVDRQTSQIIQIVKG
jgi:Zn-dependent protease with chaperone function